MKDYKLDRDFYCGLYDVIFRGLLLNNKDITCFLYNELFPNEPINPEDVEYVNSNLVEGIDFKTANMDLRFNVVGTSDRIYANIEMQKNYIKNFSFRIDCYTSKIMCEAVKSDNTYEKKKVVVISICDFDALNNKKAITIIQPKDIEDHNGYSYDWRKNVYLQLPYIHECDKIKLTKFIDILKSNKPDNLRGDDPLMNKVIDEIKKLNQDETTRAWINLFEKQQKDQNTLRLMAREEGLEEGRNQGLEEGRSQGLEEGRSQGLEEGRSQGLEEGRSQGLEEGRSQGLEEGRSLATKELAKKLKLNKMSIQDIAMLTGLSIEIIENL